MFDMLYPLFTYLRSIKQQDNLSKSKDAQQTVRIIRNIWSMRECKRY